MMVDYGAKMLEPQLNAHVPEISHLNPQAERAHCKEHGFFCNLKPYPSDTTPATRHSSLFPDNSTNGRPNVQT